MDDEGALVTCCRREENDEVREATFAEDGYDCENCPIRIADEGLEPDDKLALRLYRQLSAVSDLGLAELVFQAHGLKLTGDEAVELVERLGIINIHVRRRAIEEAERKRKRNKE